MKEIESAFVEERRNRILSLIREKRRITVKELSRLFTISDVTIRQDLNTLSSAGLIVRTHGGAVYIENNNAELSFPLRRQKKKREKETIAETAAEFVKDGEVIYLDSSSTASFMVPYLAEKHEITVITNNMETAYQLSKLPQVSIILSGGMVRKETFSLVDAPLSCVLPEGNISKAFLGAWGLSLKEGLTDVSLKEIAVKRDALLRAKRVFVLIDSTKWGRVSFKNFAGFNEVDIIITDTEAPVGTVRALTDRGAEVITVKVQY